MRLGGQERPKQHIVIIIIAMMEESGRMDIAVTMTMVLGTMVGILGGLAALQTRQKNSSNDDKSWLSGFLPSSSSQPSKRAYECWVLTYTPIWIVAFGVIVAFQLYEDFDEWSYMTVCGGLSLPFLLQPVLLPSCGYGSPDQKRPLLERYCFKANVWLAVYSFIGNYWYTHCRFNITGISRSRRGVRVGAHYACLSFRSFSLHVSMTRRCF
jgi:hypothetical protein